MEDDESRVCAVCLGLCYERFTPIRYHENRRYHTVGFNERKEAVDQGCRTCCVLQQAVRTFWGSKPDRAGQDPEEKTWEMMEPALETEISDDGVCEH
jgi:hypothetical protein